METLSEVLVFVIGLIFPTVIMILISGLLILGPSAVVIYTFKWMIGDNGLYDYINGLNREDGHKE